MCFCRQFFDNTKRPGYEMINLWSVERQGEAQRFGEHKGIDNRMLLWHGTSGEMGAPV